MLDIGEHFIYKDIEFICLNIYEDNSIFAITAKPFIIRSFDDESKNNWRTATIRRILNHDFLNMLDHKDLLKQISDLTADNGDKTYKFCIDYISILSCDQYREYRDFIPLFKDGMWTLTPWYCHPNETQNVHIMRAVDPAGTISPTYANCWRGIVPTCLFSLRDIKICRTIELK